MEIILSLIIGFIIGFISGVNLLIYYLKTIEKDYYLKTIRRIEKIKEMEKETMEAIGKMNESIEKSLEDLNKNK